MSRILIALAKVVVMAAVGIGLAYILVSAY